MPHRWWVVVLAAAACALAITLVACGGGGAPSAKKEATGTPAGFLPTAAVTAPPSAARPIPFEPLTPAPVISFDHLEGELHWAGNDSRVVSLPEGHCGDSELIQAYGVPGYIGINNDLGFWLVAVVGRDGSWRWTGYHYGDWQIWQGGDPLIIYVVYAEETRIAFEYRSFGCI